MVICDVGEPKIVEGWRRKVFDLSPRLSMPSGPIEPEQPVWSERRVEHSLLRNPEVLVRLLRLKSPDILSLGQVAEIDLYLRSENSLHLLELKGPKGPRAFNKWEGAAEEIAGQWCNAAAWIRSREETVHLWAVCLVRWKRGTAETPSNWRLRLADVGRERLHGLKEARLGLILYSFLQSPDGRLLAMWLADEAAPTLTS